jgi:hypothetical protein
MLLENGNVNAFENHPSNIKVIGVYDFLSAIVTRLYLCFRISFALSGDRFLRLLKAPTWFTVRLKVLSLIVFSFLTHKLIRKNLYFLR